MKILVSAEIVSNGVDLVYREHSQQINLCYPPKPVPDHIYKEKWRFIDGYMQLVETIKGTHTPSEMILQPEKIEFNE